MGLILRVFFLYSQRLIGYQETALFNKAVPVGVVPENISSLDASANNMMQRTGRIYSGSFWLNLAWLHHYQRKPK